MKCPSCGGPGGILLLYSTAPCTKCENQQRMRDAPPGRTMADLGIKREAKTVRYVPYNYGQEPPKGYLAIGTWSLSDPEGPNGEWHMAVLRCLNLGRPVDGWPSKGWYKNPHLPTTWSWSGDRPHNPSHAGIADMGPDPKRWVEVPDGENWGQGG